MYVHCCSEEQPHAGRPHTHCSDAHPTSAALELALGSNATPATRDDAAGQPRLLTPSMRGASTEACVCSSIHYCVASSVMRGVYALLTIPDAAARACAEQQVAQGFYVQATVLMCDEGER